MPSLNVRSVLSSEKAVLAVTLSNDRDQVLGHAAFFDYPNLPSVDPAQWEQWLNEHYDADKCSPLNTLFLHYFVSKPEYSHGTVKEIIRTMFSAVPDIHYCFLVVPTGIFPGTLNWGLVFLPAFEAEEKKTKRQSNVL